MKHTQLSNFQKEQYTAYLETQLQKFSAFMLSQRRENEKFKAVHELLSHHSDLLQQLQSQTKSLELQHNQILSNQQALFKKCQQHQDLDIRLRRLEDRDRFDCDREGRKKYQQCIKQAKHSKDLNEKGANLQSNFNEVNKRLKIIQERISKQREKQSSNIDNPSSIHLREEIEEQTASKIKKIEKKMKKYFNNKFEELQDILKNVKKHKSKSPSTRTPREKNIFSHNDLQHSEIPLTQFKLQEPSLNKSELSTVLRESNHTTRSNRHKNCSKPDPQKKKKKKQGSISRSKSKSRKSQKNKSKERSKSRSLSRSKTLEKSFTPSCHSYSSLQRSRNEECKIESKEKLSKRTGKVPSSKKLVGRSKLGHSSCCAKQKNIQ